MQSRMRRSQQQCQAWEASSRPMEQQAQPCLHQQQRQHSGTQWGDEAELPKLSCSQCTPRDQAIFEDVLSCFAICANKQRVSIGTSSYQLALYPLALVWNDCEVLNELLDFFERLLSFGADHHNSRLERLQTWK